MKIGRNDECSCGSDIKFKKCCLNKVFTINLEIKNLRKRRKPISLQVNDTETLYDLHWQILSANKWQPEHAFSFFMSEKFWDIDNEYCGNVFGEGNAGAVLKKFKFKTGDTFLYLYDYGEEHRFEVTVLNIE